MKHDVSHTFEPRKKKTGCLAYIGDCTTQVNRDYNKPWHKIPINQPGFNGKYPAGFFDRGSFVNLALNGSQYC